MYVNGTGVAPDDVEAIRWYRRAADKGYADAQVYLGLMYDSGNGVPADPAQAARWFRKAADQGSAKGEFNLAVSYQDGAGVPQDAAQAALWYRKAAEQGLASAQNNLGLMLASGVGIEADLAQAAYWYRNAAEQGLRRSPSPGLVRGVLDAAMSVYLDRFLNVPATRLPVPQDGEPAALLGELRNLLDRRNVVAVRRDTGLPQPDSAAVDLLAETAYQAHPEAIPYESARYRASADLDRNGFVEGRAELFPLYLAAARDYTQPVFAYGPPRLARLGVELLF
jgi:TPR repeat protein